MLKRLLFLICISLFCSPIGWGQADIWLQSYSQPSPGCDLSSAENVQVSILNTSSIPIPSNSISVGYTINNGPVTNEFVPTNLFPNASINFSFSVDADLSACQNHLVKVWVASSGDPNQSNDTLTWWVQNDCTVIPGYVDTTTNVCITSNSGILTLEESANGTISAWEMSTNGGSNWTPTGETGITQSYSMVNIPTMYRVQIDGGYCPNATSATATITPVSPPALGSVSIPDSVCITNANGTISLTGTSGSIISWETSLDGSFWSPNGNTANNLNYNLTETTFFRALLDGNGCPDVYTDETHVFVENNADGGTVSGPDSLCFDNASGSLIHSGTTGPIDHWEWSTDGLFWNNIASTASVLPFNSLTQTTYYHVMTAGDFCPDQYSNIHEVFVQQQYTPPNLLGSDTVCETAITGTLSLETVPSDVLEWQFSEDGSLWTSVVNNSSTYNVALMAASSDVRVLLDGGVCPDYFSTIAHIQIDKLTEGGSLQIAQDSFCITNSSGSIFNNSGLSGLDIDYWEYSTDEGDTWLPIANTGNTYTFSSLSESMWIRSHSNGGACPSFYSDTVKLYVEDEVNGGILLSDTAVCDIAYNGNLSLSGNTGNIEFWEYSEDGGSFWQNISNTTNAHAYSNISTETQFRVFSSGDLCPGTYSNVVSITIDDFSVAGVLNNDLSVCENDSAYIELVNSLGTTYVWESSVDGNNWVNHTSSNNIYDSIAQVTTAQFFRVIVSNGVCPPDTSNTIEISILPVPLVTVSPDTSVLLGESVSIWAAGGDTGMWEDSEFLNDPNSNSPTVTPDSTQYFYYGAIDANGCVSIDSVLVEVLPPLMIDIKNVVTTNGDGYNDTWIIEGVENFPNTAVKVFNIYGKLVYSSEDYQNDWGGTFKEKVLPNGTYLYVVTLNESQEEIKGTLSLLGENK